MKEQQLEQADVEKQVDLAPAARSRGCAVRDCREPPGPALGLCVGHERGAVAFLDSRKKKGQEIPKWKIRTLLGVYVNEASVALFRKRKAEKKEQQVKRAKVAGAA